MAELPIRSARIRYEIAGILMRRGLSPEEVAERIAELRVATDDELLASEPEAIDPQPAQDRRGPLPLDSLG